MRGDMIHLRRNFEIGRFLHLKSEIRNFELDPGRQPVQSSNFKVRILGWMFI